MSANIGSSTLALAGQVEGHEACYARTVTGYFGSDRSVTQIIRVCEHGSGQVRINLFVDGDFAGTWVKSTAHFTNIIEWGSWVHVDQKAVTNLQAPLRQQQQRQHKESSSPNNHLPHPHYHYARTNNNSVPVAETASKPGPPPLTQPQHGQGREHQQEKQRRKPSFHLGAAGLAASLSGSSGAADAIAVTGTPPVPPLFSDDNRESAQPGGEKGTVITRT